MDTRGGCTAWDSFGRSHRQSFGTHPQLGQQSLKTFRHSDVSEFEWTETHDALLGTMPDIEVAKSLGRTKSAIHRRRGLVGIPKFKPAPNEWTQKEDVLLGTGPDEEVAMKLGRTAYAVNVRRRQLKIPLPGANLKPWTPTEEALLGTMPDEEIARLLGRSRQSVASHRLTHGIDYQGAQRRRCTKEEESMLGVIPDRKLAKKLKRSLASVTFRRLQLGLPPSFTVDPSRPSGDLPSTTTDPELSGGSGNVRRNLTAKWDCICIKDAKDKKTKLKSN
ncbi:MAG: hypothetical protein JWM16_5047 [Verrucomicrobiales bacterium]|nr:hypothetical protein [Verrucomicrobiales bacterium]